MKVTVVREGSAVFPSITLYTTDGDSETAIAFAAVTALTWSRTVVGTGEVVNSRTDENAISLVTAMPFELPQEEEDNTLVDSTRRRERHLVVLEFTYTRDSLPRDGRYEMEFLIIPANRVVYGPITEDSRYLKDINIGYTATDEAGWNDIWEIEEDATEYIEGQLGKRFFGASNAVPRHIEKIALMLGSAEVINNLHGSQGEGVSAFGADLRKRAMELLAEVASGAMGIQYPDGSWDASFPAPAAGVQLAGRGKRQSRVFDPSLPFRKQHAHTATTDDDTDFGHDDRSPTREYSE